MRVNCPNCGREFDIPESEGHRMLKCLCKNLFRANQALAGKTHSAKADTPPSSTASSSVTEPKAPAGADYFSDEKSVDDVESSMSSAELEGFLSDLKKPKDSPKSPEEVRTAPARSADAPKVRLPDPAATIELGESRAERKPAKKEPKDFETELLESMPEPSQPSLDDISMTIPSKVAENPTFERSSRARHTRTETKFWDKLWSQFTRAHWGVQAGIGFALFLPVIALMALLFWPEEKPEQAMDPAISKLLTPQPKRQEAKPSKPAEVPPPPSPKPAEVTPAASAKSSAPQSDQKRYEKLYASTLNGDFENVIRLAASHVSSLQPEELALYFEAQLVRAGKDSKRISEIRGEIDSALKSTGRDTALLRAHSVSVLRDPQQKDDLKRVVETLRSLSLTRARDPFVFTYLGMTYEKFDRLDLSHNAWDQALTLEPRLAWLLQRREQIYRNQSDLKNAQAMAARLARIKGFEADGLARQAMIAKLSGNTAEATKLYRQSLKYDDNFEVRMTLVKSMEDRPDEAIAELQSSLKSATDRAARARVFTGLGRAYCLKSDPKTGAAYLRKAVKEKSDHSEAYSELGLCQRSAKNYSASVEAFENALKYDQQDPQLWTEYSISLQLFGKLNPAIAALKRSLQIDPTDTAHLQLAQILVKLNRPEEALGHAKKAAALNPNNRRARGLVAQLEK